MVFACIVHVSKSVKGVASLPCGYPFSPDELTRLRVYWQKDDKAVLSYTPEKIEVWSQYKNRTVLDISSNFSLMILSLSLSDRGIYTCVIQKSEGGVHKRKHLASVKLFVRADYPVPNITDLGNSSADIKRIMCLTSGGFPKPHLFWLENGKELSGINTTISQDPETELYTVSSKLDFNMTYNHSIVCHVVYGDSQVSKNFTWEKPPEAPPYRNHLIEVTPTILTVLCLASAIILIIVYSSTITGAIKKQILGARKHLDNTETWPRSTKGLGDLESTKTTPWPDAQLGVVGITKTSASGPMPSSFEKTDHCMSRCDSQRCILAQEEEQQLQNGDRQPNGHVHCVHFSSLAYLLISMAVVAVQP
ncbi:T-lymphocyte activation antigen CD80 [Peromyscus eremicus]|uniref:T-lymphocyte activation antigen CD80 n=1 Tax=Peromyscus eremicus TaxID=42410 RepID=UPI0027DC5941|nr:T-lymphocyte activation antigen CD80 [Peromyscus eremicus]